MTPLEALAKTGAALRPGQDADAVAGIVPAHVAAPADVDQVSAVMRAAAEHGLAVVARGRGTRLDWGAPPRQVDLLVDLAGLDRVLDHAADDLVVEVEAGVAVDHLAEVLARAGQRLAVDVPAARGSDRGSVGGVLATAVSGPRRLRYGTARDLLIGITVVRADGTVAKSGGRVVKNVAGYDLGKLFTGSLGTLGVIVRAAFRLHPLPAAAAYAIAETASTTQAHRAAQAVLHSQLDATAIEIDRPAGDRPITVAVLIEGVPGGVSARVDQARDLLAEAVAGPARVCREAPGWWGIYPDGETLIKVAARTGSLPQVLDTLHRAAAACGISAAVRGSAGVGVLHVGVGAPVDATALTGFLDTVRPALARHDGSAVVLRASAGLRGQVDLWGPVGPALPLMRKVKERFDPDHRLAPGRFAGGI